MTAIVFRSFFLVALVFLVTASFYPAQVAVVVRIGPPPLPVYDQPICPGEGYLWTPGYWAWDEEEYYWVPGTWVMAPEPGLLWTPGYWTWDDGGYRWYAGYWAPHVGFYGGIDYGYGYPGEGFYGGEWRGNVYRYNTVVTNVNTTIIHNTYNTTVTNNYTTVNRVSYNGGNGGTTARPTAADLAVAQEAHRPATPMQTQQQQTAKSNREFHVSINRGKPPIAATPKPGVFSGPGVVAAREAASPNAQPRQEAAPNMPERPNPNASKPPDNKPPARENPPKNPHEKPAPPPPSNPQPREKPPESRTKPQPQEKPSERPAPQPQSKKPEPHPKPEPPDQHLGRI
jgi:hypothetical protein